MLEVGEMRPLAVANGMWKEQKFENTQEAGKEKRSKLKLYSSSLLQKPDDLQYSQAP